MRAVADATTRDESCKYTENRKRCVELMNRDQLSSAYRKWSRVLLVGVYVLKT